MTPDWDSITDIIYNKLKGSNYKVKMFDADMQATFDPTKARHFYAVNTEPSDAGMKSYKIVVNVNDENAQSSIDLQTPKFKSQVDFNNMLSLQNYFKKNISDRSGVSVNWHQFNVDITPKEPAPVAESADISKPWGTTKSSFQKVGNCRVIIRHTDTINEEVPGSRWRKIHKVFVETPQGERFAFPVPHMRGARALARHISEGGTGHDGIASYIKGLSEDFHNLKAAMRKLRGPSQTHPTLAKVLADYHDEMHSINNKLNKWVGPRGYQRQSADWQEPQSTANVELPQWLKTIADTSCEKQVPVLSRYYKHNAGHQPELDEFNDWLAEDELVDDTVDTDSNDSSADTFAQDSYNEYRQESDSSEKALNDTLQFVIANNDWWRQHWEQDPDATQQHLRDLVWQDEPTEDPELERMKKLAGM